jgi:hypothetical protein
MADLIAFPARFGSRRQHGVVGRKCPADSDFSFPSSTQGRNGIGHSDRAGQIFSQFGDHQYAKKQTRARGPSLEHDAEKLQTFRKTLCDKTKS